MSDQTIIKELFGVSEDEALYDDYECAFSDNVLRQGSLYIFENHIGFYSTIIGKFTLLIAFADIISMLKKSVVKLFPSAIAFKYKDNDALKEATFISFSKRDQVYVLIGKYWKSSCPAALVDDSEEILEVMPISTTFTLPSREDTIETMNFNMGAEEFFKVFYSNKAKLTKSYLFEKLECKNIKEGRWEVGENGKEHKRNTLDYRLKGVPFVNFAGTIEEYTLERKNDIIEISNHISQPGIMTGDCFYTLETTEIIGDEHKCMVRWSCENKFIKNTMWKGTIIKRTKGDAIKMRALWRKEALLAKLIPEETSTLGHELEDATKYELDDLVCNNRLGKLWSVIDSVCMWVGDAIAEKKISVSNSAMIAILSLIAVLILICFLNDVENRMITIDKSLKILLARFLQPK